MQSKGMFSDIKILELASVLAGPSVGQFFAELGAEVIKIENPATHGDVTRSWKLKGEQQGNVSAYFSSINWGKRSMSLDISADEGRQLLYRLVVGADMIIASYKPGDAEKLGVDYASLKSVKSNIIYGKITGYGDKNHKVGYDAIIQAEAGFMSMNGAVDGPPTKMPVALMDVLAGHHLKEAMLVAYIHLLRTGEGSEVSVSLIEAAVASLANQSANWLVAGKLPARQGSMHPNIAPYGDIFTTKDKREIILAVGTDRQFKNLCGALGRSDLAGRSDYADNTLRVENRHRLYVELEEKIATMEAVDILAQLNNLKVPAGAVQNVKEALQMEEVQNLRLSNNNIEGVGTFSAHFNGENVTLAHLLAPPEYGVHTREILGKLGLSEEEMSQLSRDGII